jgi:hypothetical protein
MTRWLTAADPPTTVDVGRSDPGQPPRAPSSCDLNCCDQLVHTRCGGCD